MLLPNKFIHPSDSVYCISAYVLSLLKEKNEQTFFELLDNLNNIYIKDISINIFQLCLDFLFILGKIEVSNEIIKVIL